MGSVEGDEGNKSTTRKNFEGWWYDWRCKHGKNDTAKARELAYAGWLGALENMAEQFASSKQQNAGGPT